MSSIADKETIEKVENFIRRFHDRDYIIIPRASEIIYGKESLADQLARAIADYEALKKYTSVKMISDICLLWIDRAFAHGVVQEGAGLVHKLKECSEKNAQLEKELTELSTAYQTLRENYEGLRKRLRLPNDIGVGTGDQ